MDAANCNKCADTGGVFIRHGRYLDIIWRSEDAFRCTCPAGEKRTDLEPMPESAEDRGLYFWLPVPEEKQLQEARDNLLELRQWMGSWYDSLPAPDKLLRHLDRAIELVPGEGEPSKEPYG